MSINIEPKYLSTDKTCIYFDISKQFLINLKNKGTLKNGIHYIQPTTKLLRWNVEEIEKEFGVVHNKMYEPQDAINDTDIAHFLK